MKIEDTIAVIPIRAGSKGLKDKNIYPLNGKPLVLYSVEALISSGVVNPENIFVASDSDEYLRVIRESYPEVSVFKRDESDASDSSTTADFVLNFLDKVGTDKANLILCQATSPLRTGQQIREAFQMYENTDCSSVVSVTRASKSPSLMTVLEDGRMKDIVGIDIGYRRQNKADYYYPNGATYIVRIQSYMDKPSFFNEDSLGYVMNGNSSIDVDGIDDIKKAERILKK